MIRSTAEASSTNLPAPPPAISAGKIRAFHLLRAGIKYRCARRKGNCLEIGKSLPATLAAIAATGLLKRLQICQAAGHGRRLPLLHLPVPAHGALHGDGDIPAGAPAQLMVGPCRSPG